jgi:ribosomal protein S27AE
MVLEVTCLDYEDSELNFVETGICPNCGAEINLNCGIDKWVYSCSKCGWFEVVPSMPEWSPDCGCE